MMHGEAVENSTKRPADKKIAIVAPKSCAANWFFGFARRRCPVFKSPTMSVAWAAAPAEREPAMRLVSMAEFPYIPWPLVTPPKTICEAFALGKR